MEFPSDQLIAAPGEVKLSWNIFSTGSHSDTLEPLLILMRQVSIEHCIEVSELPPLPSVPKNWFMLKVIPSGGPPIKNSYMCGDPSLNSSHTASVGFLGPNRGSVNQI